MKEYNVLQYGAVGDGATNDAFAIQHAIDDCAKNGGGRVVLQSGYVSYYYEYASGIKTGSTEEAGYCVITKASKDGYNYLAVVLGAPVIDYNSDGYVEKCSFIDAASLFDWAFDSLKYTTLVSESDVIDEVPVENGKDADAVQLVRKM